MSQTNLTEMDTGQQQSHQRADLRAIAAQTGSLSPKSLERCTGLARAVRAHCIQQTAAVRPCLYHHDKAIILYIIIILEI